MKDQNEKSGGSVLGDKEEKLRTELLTREPGREV